ncbi:MULTISPECIES: GNAT family N-acetyltransferase [unclassified Pseudoclavibacter]|uniref:GNAT family N-acetyltransferase n=1 Tax=unclassified Pseudoclavibacter TaxID=2615177 RepID=UPI00130194E2|nr:MULTISPECIES: GNAT family N-acetyltransferase [unclassified Pseudoclavibacter]KAB1644457.1 GNAT family N-acetyltransferase [Pseudoclavibacter sp. CFCC 14310]KAB1664039.1 GNAT family N-acetyltransferase [Pseudoclavibacter sp. CFCC 13611]
MTDVQTDQIVVVSLADPISQPLLDELDHEYSTRYADYHGFDQPRDAPSEIELYPPFVFEPPLGLALLIVRSGVPVAGGAFMHLDDRTVEYKRIWTSSAHRRQGLSRRVLAALDVEAAARGYSRVYLTTGPRQPEAKQLYLRTGFTPLFDVDEDPEKVVHLAFEKRIVPTGPRVRDLSESDRGRQAKQLERIVWAQQYHPAPAVRLDDLAATEPTH